MIRGSRRRFLGGLGALLALSACGQAPSVPTATPTVFDVRSAAATAAAFSPGAATPAGRGEPTRLPGGTPGPVATVPVASPTPTLVPPKPTITPTAVPPTPTPIAKAPPRRLEIPRIGVNAPIVKIGLHPSGEMEAPDGPRDVGWFGFGPKPGEPGNAVMTGHLDWRTGETAVFWRLKELTPGDEIVVETERETLRFMVEATERYGRDDAPVEQILGFKMGQVLTILTCEGTFIPAERDYTHRRVVRARLA